MLELSSTDGHLAAVAQRQRSVLVLEEDPDLAEGLGAEDRERATRLLRAAVLDLPAGSWIPPSGEAGDFGLLVLDGLIGRNVALGKGVSVEIIGPGHLIRPWDDWFAQPMVETTVSWEVCEPATVAVLGRQAATVIGHWPELSVAFSGRLLRRIRSQSVLMAAANFTRVEDRLLAAMWHLGGMWGRVSPEGIVLPFRLTHETLAHLVGARRPSVTLAMGALRREGRVVRRTDGRYVLLGAVPAWCGEVDDDASLLEA